MLALLPFLYIAAAGGSTQPSQKGKRPCKASIPHHSAGADEQAAVLELMAQHGLADEVMGHMQDYAF
jgi:hypothetical protein